MLKRAHSRHHAPAHGEKVKLGADFAELGQVAARLAHQPEGQWPHAFAGQHTQQGFLDLKDGHAESFRAGNAIPASRVRPTTSYKELKNLVVVVVGGCKHGD